jgi:arylsulfatase A-like enzyme
MGRSDQLGAGDRPSTGTRGRNILFVTTDQQRYDSLGCNGGAIARTPVVDSLAAAGINYRRAYNQNTVCMPSRSTMLTGQYVRTHGVVANGIPLPGDAPSVAAYLRDRGGYRTALLGKAHFEPGLDPEARWEENARARRGDIGPWRGFERSIQAMHAAAEQTTREVSRSSLFPPSPLLAGVHHAFHFAGGHLHAAHVQAHPHLQHDPLNRGREVRLGVEQIGGRRDHLVAGVQPAHDFHE